MFLLWWMFRSVREEGKLCLVQTTKTSENKYNLLQLPEKHKIVTDKYIHCLRLPQMARANFM